MEAEIPYSALEADLNFDMMCMAKSAQGDKEIDIPITITVGVTISLCGLFLIFVPLPGCAAAGWWLMNAGGGILGSEALAKWDQYDRDQKVKK